MRHLIFLLILFAFKSNAQIEATTWYQGKQAAVVMTFDDWTPGQKHLLKILRKYNLPATLFITEQNLYWPGAVDSLKTANKLGAEIANHSKTHASLPSLSASEMSNETTGTRQRLLNQVPGAEVLTYAYPHGSKNRAVIDTLKKEHIAARGIMQPNEGSISPEFNNYNVPTVRLWKHVSYNKFQSWIEYACKGNGLLTFMAHSIYLDSEAPKGWDPLPLSYHDRIFNYLKQTEDTVWITTLQKAVQYKVLRKNISIDTLKANDRMLKIKLNHSLDSTKYNHLITLALQQEPKSVMIDIENQKVRSLNNKFLIDCPAFEVITINW